MRGNAHVRFGGREKGNGAGVTQPPRPFPTLLAPLGDQERRDVLEVLEDRSGSRATLVASQLPLKSWHAYIGEPTIADAVLDRLVHSAHQIELKGESLRKKRSGLTKEGTSDK